MKYILKSRSGLHRSDALWEEISSEGEAHLLRGDFRSAGPDPTAGAMVKIRTEVKK